MVLNGDYSETGELKPKDYSLLYSSEIRRFLMVSWQIPSVSVIWKPEDQ